MGTSYLSMQRCGVDLTCYLRNNGPMSLKDALGVATAIVSWFLIWTFNLRIFICPADGCPVRGARWGSHPL